MADGDEITRRCAAEPETDIGNARRLLMRYGAQLQHVTRVGWHVYDGRRWAEDESGSMVRRAAHQTAEAIYEEADLIPIPTELADAIALGDIARQNLARPFDARSASRDELQAHTAQRKVWTDQIKHAETMAEEMDDRRRRRFGHAKSSCATSKLNAMLTEAAAYCPLSVNDLNRDLYAINMANGTLRFIDAGEDPESDPDDPRRIWTARLDPHKAEDLISKCAPHDYDPDARAPQWERFLVRTQPSPAMRDYLQRLAGYTLLGVGSDQMFAFFYGIGRNGKSTFIDTLARILSDYAVTMSIDSFVGDDRRSGSEATPDLARLPGARLVAASEPEVGVQFKESLIKRLTGGESLAVRRLHQDFFEFSPQFTIIVSGNDKPMIRGNDDGIWRRIHLVPWDEQIPKDEVDRRLPEKLMSEASGILAWAVRGALAWLCEGGLNPPREILDATQDYREEEDPIGSFIRNACLVTGDAENDREGPLDLYMAFERYANQNAVIPLKQTTFTKRLPAAVKRTWPGPDGESMRQFSKIKTNGQTRYAGIRILDKWRAENSEEAKGYGYGKRD